MARTRIAAISAKLAAIALATGVWFHFALRRYHAVHNETFDLALYARGAWGLAHENIWDPLLGGTIFQVHLSPILAPLGWIGRLFGTVETLLFAQALAFALTAALLGRFAQNTLSSRWAWWLGFLLCALYPNLSHVATYEFHVSNLGILGTAFALVMVQEGRRVAFACGCAWILACREDGLTLVLPLAAYAWFRLYRHHETLDASVRANAPFLSAQALQRRSWQLVPIQLTIMLAISTWLSHTLRGMHRGGGAQSIDLHFGGYPSPWTSAEHSWGDLLGAIFDHLLAPAQLGYLPLILAPLAFLPLLGLRILWLALPLLAFNLLSQFPTTTLIESHYLTLIVPILVAAAIEGLARLLPLLAKRAPLFERRPWLPALACVALPLLLFPALGPSPADPAFTDDAQTRAARAVIAQIGPSASVQAPYALLPHLAERRALHFPPPPDRQAEWVVLELSHRDRYAGQESLLRTIEEPIVRTWLARAEYGVALHAHPYLAFQRGVPQRRALAPFQLAPAPEGAIAALREGEAALCDCLVLERARALAGEAAAIELIFRARGPCPDDLALRVGRSRDDHRVDLLFEGTMSPSALRAGDRFFSRHPVAPGALTEGAISVGALRSSGAVPAPGDPYLHEIALSAAAATPP